MKKFWQTISYLGVGTAKTGENQRRWVLTNRLAFLWLLLGGLSLFTYPSYTDPVSGDFHWISFFRVIIAVLVGGFGLMLNARGKVSVTKMLLSFVMPVPLLLLSLIEGTFTGLDFVWVPMMLLAQSLFPFLLFDPKYDRRYFWFAIAFNVFLCLVADVVIQNGLATHETIPPIIQDNYVTYKGVFLFFVLFINGGLLYLKLTNHQSQKQLQAQLEQTQTQSQKIASQNEELVEQRAMVEEHIDELKQQQEEIQRINENLEFMVQQRTQELEQQNHQLAEYAFINGTMLRAPLCRVQGLIYLMELSDKITEDDPMYIHLKESVEEFSEVVTRINRMVEEGKHFDRYDFAKGIKSDTPNDSIDFSVES